MSRGDTTRTHRPIETARRRADRSPEILILAAGAALRRLLVMAENGLGAEPRPLHLVAAPTASMLSTIPAGTDGTDSSVPDTVIASTRDATSAYDCNNGVCVPTSMTRSGCTQLIDALWSSARAGQIAASVGCFTMKVWCFSRLDSGQERPPRRAGSDGRVSSSALARAWRGVSCRVVRRRPRPAETAA